MSPNQLVTDTKNKLAQAIQHFISSLQTLRTSRANAAMLDGVMVDAYGSTMPLNQVANVTAPEAQLLQITPFDPNNLAAISTAIRNNPTLGFNPVDDGRVVRINVPALTEERRRDLAKQVGQKQEECMVSLRSIRREALDAIDQAKKDKQIGEDEAKRLGGQVEEMMNKTRGEAESAAESKEREILTL